MRITTTQKRIHALLNQIMQIPERKETNSAVFITRLFIIFTKRYTERGGAFQKLKRKKKNQEKN